MLMIVAVLPKKEPHSYLLGNYGFTLTNGRSPT